MVLNLNFNKLIKAFNPMRANYMTIFLCVKIFLCAESNIFLTQESHKNISGKQDAVIKPLKSSYGVDNDESFVIKDDKKSDLTNKIIEGEHDNIETIETNNYKQYINEKNPVKILKRLNKDLSQLIASFSGFNFLKFLDESIFLIDCYLGTFAGEENIGSKILQTTIKKTVLHFEKINKLMAIVKKIQKHKEGNINSFNFHCVKNGLIGLEKNYLSLKQEFELFQISRVKNEENSNSMKIHTIFELQKKFKSILKLFNNLDDKVIQEQENLIKNDFLKNVFKIYNNLFKYYENEGIIFNLDREILENILINNIRCHDDLISFKKTLEQK